MHGEHLMLFLIDSKDGALQIWKKKFWEIESKFWNGNLENHFIWKVFIEKSFLKFKIKSVWTRHQFKYNEYQTDKMNNYW